MTLHKPKIVPFSHLFLIQAVAGPDDPHSYFLNAVQQVIDTIIPESLWLERKEGIFNPAEFFCRLESMLPIFKYTTIDNTSDSMVLTYLCPAQYAPNGRRFIFDTLTKRLIPGKQTEIIGGIQLNFQFVMDPSRTFFVAQKIVAIHNREEGQAMRENLPALLVELKRKFAPEFLKHPECFAHPLFMPRNEEEMIRNLIVLATQIKYVRDLPQVSIHYEKQTDGEIAFTILAARLLKGKILPLHKLLEKSGLKTEIDDVRVMGFLKQKYPKEGAVFRITLDKKPFFRPDGSVDLLRARQKIVAELTDCLGNFRDFNGGIILKQEQALAELRKEFGPLLQEQEFLLETYFYSLKPALMQTVHDTQILKKHFELLQTALKADLRPHIIVGESVEKFFLCFIVAAAPAFKEAILKGLAPLHIASRDLTTSSLDIGQTSALGFILRTESTEIVEQFQQALFVALR